MKVTRLIQQIGKCRDLLEEGNLKKIASHIGLFVEITDYCHRHIDKYIMNPAYELDFTPYDLQELSDEIYNFITPYQTNFLFKYGYNEVMKQEIINDAFINNFNNKICEQMFVDARLREAYKVAGYLAITLLLWQEFRKRQNDSKNGNTNTGTTPQI